MDTHINTLFTASRFLRGGGSLLVVPCFALSLSVVLHRLHGDLLAFLSFSPLPEHELSIICARGYLH